MRFKGKDVVITVVLTASLFMIFECLTGRAGNLEPNEPPGPTMVTLGELNSKIEALSWPVQKIVRGKITFDKYEKTKSEGLSAAVDPDHSIVLLSDAVASEHPSADNDIWFARTGACLSGLTSDEITIQVEPHPAEQNVSYQIIEYK